MSDWTDLQLAHSLAPVRAPEDLWARIAAASSAPPARHSTFGWAVPCAVAACLALLMIRASGMELRPPRAEFRSNDPVAVEKWLAHEAGISMPFRQAGMRVRSARVVRRGVAAVDYEVDGRMETVTLSCTNPNPSRDLSGANIIMAASTGRSEAACRNCHSL